MMPCSFALAVSRLLVFLLLALAASCYAQDSGKLQAIPALQARVTDLTGTLDAAQYARLEGRLAAFEAEGGTQIVILLVPTTQPEDIASYANRVFNIWKPGRQGVGDGLLLVVAKQDRKVRVEVARALEGAIPDLAAKQVIDEFLTPRFRQGDFAGGLEQASEQFMRLIRGEALPPPSAAARPAPGRDGVDWMDFGVLAFIIVPLLGSLARRLLGRKLGTLATGGVVGFIAFGLTASLLLALLAALVAMLLTFLAGSPAGSALLSSGQHRRGGPWDGGWSTGAGGSGWGGGGGGGFSSGGGGDGAGGGASGDW